MSPAGSLTVVGTGIQAGAQTTAEARAAIEGADEVLYLVENPVAAAWLEGLNPRARSLRHLYRPDSPRAESYARIAREIARSVRAGANVCVAFYGHPGVFVRPAHDVIGELRAEGYRATMQAGVSAEDCLFADLGVDPGQLGCQSYEATDFLIRSRTPDTHAALVLWQLSVLGSADAATEPDSSRLPFLVERLLRFYPGEHEVVLYEASPYPVLAPLVQRVPLSALATARIAAMTTLYVPPVATPPVDLELVDSLGMPRP
jgi:uncharacterized protein YabN with tetrapyrrole methylase and pyrophosphatase domain